jgi:hypothetical protein
MHLISRLYDMAKYLWKAKAPDGKTVVKRIEAATLADSKRVLENAGFTELQAQSDDFSAAAEGMFNLGECGDVVELTPEQELEIFNRGRSTLVGVIWQALSWGLFSEQVFTGTTGG